MDRDRQDIRPPVEDLLRPVAAVVVDVQDDDLPQGAQLVRGVKVSMQ